MAAAEVNTSASAPATPEDRTRPAFGRFRSDIQGLRAVAVGAVLLFHANAPFLTGGFVGVDVFFVISGYLITGILVREAAATGRVSLAGFYAKRVRRILPAATVMLVCTAAASALLLPQIRWQSVGVETVAAAFYVVNWVFAAGTDYLNAEVAASPLQHFWTLAVEEQFYIVWPLVIVALLAVAGRTGRGRAGATRLLRWGALLLLAPSLVWSIAYTASDPAPAYFVTTTRLWELAVGAAVAVFAARLERLPDAAGLLLGWAGLAGILAAGLWYTPSTPFPGAAALLPTLSAAAVIVGGMGGRANRGAGALLSLAPMRWVGDISYSLYLWHWPLVVIATYLLGGELRFRYGLLVVALSVLPAWLSYRYVENPFRDWGRIRHRARTALWAGAGMVAVSALVGTGLAVAPLAVAQGAPDRASARGALALEDDPEAGEPVDAVAGGFTPAAVEARKDNPVIYKTGCHADLGRTEDPGCTLGAADADITVALVGDSHAASWVPALESLAREHGWRLRVFTKSACPFADVLVSNGGEPYTACAEWNEDVAQILEAERPDLVVAANAAQRNVWDDGASRGGSTSERLFADGLRRSWTRLNEAGIPVVALADVPRMDLDVPECVSANPARLTACGVPREEAVDAQPKPERLAASRLERTALVDMTRWICPSETCVPVIGNVLIWRDGHHLTATYAATLAAPLGRELAALDFAPVIRD